jgi:5'-nucleotidase
MLTSTAGPLTRDESAPHILLTNDDGYDREGLQVLRTALLADGFRVTVVAPATNKSGVGRGVTCHGPVTVRLHDDDGAGNRVFSCQGTPVDCVRVALLSDLVGPVDVVASGINHGVNMGDDSTFSGTIGAALEGALLGVPSVAFSQQDDAGDISMISRGSHHFLLTRVAVKAIRLLNSIPPPPRVIASINFPHGAIDPAIEPTGVSAFTYRRDWTPSEVAGDDTWNVWAYAKPGHSDPVVDASAGTDYYALAAGAVSVSALRTDWDGLSEPPTNTCPWLMDFTALLGAAESSVAPSDARAAVRDVTEKHSSPTIQARRS